MLSKKFALVSWAAVVILLVGAFVQSISSTSWAVTTRTVVSGSATVRPHLIIRRTATGSTATGSTASGSRVRIPLRTRLSPVKNPPVCVDTSWTPDASIVLRKKIFSQTSNCGRIRTRIGTMKP